jgi:hypothetical protein
MQAVWSRFMGDSPWMEGRQLSRQGRMQKGSKEKEKAAGEKCRLSFPARNCHEPSHQKFFASFFKKAGLPSACFAISKPARRV